LFLNFGGEGESTIWRGGGGGSEVVKKPKTHNWTQNVRGRAKYLAAAVRIRVSGVMLRVRKWPRG